MPNQSDANFLFDIYALLQDVMAQHLTMSETLQAATEESLELQEIENIATDIIKKCDDLSERLNPKACTCCCQAS